MRWSHRGPLRYLTCSRLTRSLHLCPLRHRACHLSTAVVSRSAEASNLLVEVVGVEANRAGGAALPLVPLRTPIVLLCTLTHITHPLPCITHARAPIVLHTPLPVILHYIRTLIARKGGGRCTHRTPVLLCTPCAQPMSNTQTQHTHEACVCERERGTRSQRVPLSTTRRPTETPTRKCREIRSPKP